jgi:hypothetical protein
MLLEPERVNIKQVYDFVHKLYVNCLYIFLSSEAAA